MDAVEDALDADDPKAALGQLILEHAAAHGPTERVVSALTAGGDGTAELVLSALKRGVDLLEQHVAASPRKARRGIRDTTNRAEVLIESIDSVWCDSISCYGAEDLQDLSRHLCDVQDLSADSEGVTEAVVRLLDALDQVGSPLLMSLALLKSGGMQIDALESLRGLSEAHQTSVNDDEVSAFRCVKELLSVSTVSVDGNELLTSACMAWHTLCCRNGLAVCADVSAIAIARRLTLNSIEVLGSGLGCGELTAAYASGAVAHLLWIEAPCKCSPDLRAPLEKAGVGNYVNYTTNPPPPTHTTT